MKIIIKVKRIIFPVLLLILLGACGKKDDKNKALIPSDASLEQLNSLIEKNPDDTGLLFERAKYYYKNQLYDKTIEEINSILKKDSLNPDYYHLLADAYMDSAQSRFALSTMKKLINKYPDRIESLLKLSELFFIVKEYDNSISTVNSILYLSPNNPEAYFMLGVNFKEMQELSKAKNSFKTVVENDPGHVDAWLQLGQIAEEQGDTTAITYYKNAIKTDTSSIEAIHYLAYYYQNHNRIDEALSLYRKMSIMNPTNTSSYLNAGLIYMKMDSLPKAYDNFNLLVNISKANPKAYYYRGLVQYLNGDNVKAKIDFEQCLKIDPEFSDAKTMLNKIKKTR
ncbi:MAG: tetratricopeptide repeat protein [Deltaproteobacteria bacterium]